MSKQSTPTTVATENQSEALLIEIPDVSSMEGVPNVSAMVEDFAPQEYYRCQKTDIITRPPSLSEQDRLMKYVTENGLEVCCDIRKGPAWIAELDGKIIGCLRARLIFEVQPFPVQAGPLMPEINERAEQLLLEACHRWMRSFRNGLGVDETLQVATTPDRQSLLIRLGWKALKVAEGALFGKTFGGTHDGK